MVLVFPNLFQVNLDVVVVVYGVVRGRNNYRLLKPGNRAYIKYNVI